MPNETETIGKRLRARRMEKSLTIAQVAESAGLSLPYVSNLERGLGNPTLEALTALAQALEVSLSLLVGDKNVSEPLDITLAAAPNSLLQFSRSADFQETIRSIALQLNVPPETVRKQVLIGMVSSPRRSNAEPTEDDWRRILDAYSLILRK